MPKCYLRFIAALALAIPLVGCAQTKIVRVGIFEDAGVGGKGVPRVTELLGKTDDIKVSKLNGKEIASGALTNFDVVIFTGGSGSKQAASLGEKGRGEVRRFVREGGGYIGICAGAYLACTGFEWGVGVLNAKTVSSKWMRGTGNVEIEINPKGAALASLTSGKQKVFYANGPIIQPDDRKDIPAYEPLALFRTELAKNGSPRGAMIDSPALVRGFRKRTRAIFESTSRANERNGRIDSVLRALGFWQRQPVSEPLKILFICSQNRWRSLTAEKMYDGFQGYIVRSAGTEKNARICVNEGHIGWADVIFTMEKRHNERLRDKFPATLQGKKLICLHIDDDYQFMNSNLQEVLKERLKPHIEVP